MALSRVLVEGVLVGGGWYITRRVVSCVHLLIHLRHADVSFQLECRNVSGYHKSGWSRARDAASFGF